MHALFDHLTFFVGKAIDILWNMSPVQFLLVFWPLLLLSVPRFLLSEIFILIRSYFERTPSAKAHFVACLQRDRPLVSILLPSYNEADTLEGTVQALLEQTYPNFEIIVVSDGSDDGMDEVGRRLARLGWIRYFENAKRGGKSAASNLAFKASRGEYIVYCDADSTFDRNALWHLLAEFYRPDVAAVSGNVRVRNAATNLLTRCQALQYIMGIGVGRRVMDWLGILFIISGAFGAVRRSTLESIGAWQPGPGEDADLTLKLRVSGGQIAFAPDAICMTDAPDKWFAYYRQQIRWNRSVVRFRLRNYRWLLYPRRPFTWTNLIGTLDLVVFQVAFACIFPFYLIWLYTTYYNVFWYLLFSVTLIYVLINYMHYGIALALSERRTLDSKLFPYVPLYGLFMGWWLRLVRLVAYADEWMFKSSYRSPYVPDNVQRQMRQKHPW